MDNFFKKITTNELLDVLNNPEYKIIDVRTADAYNGWPLKNELRGGHIWGAKNLPLKWINYIDWIEVVRQKELWTHQTIILYGNNEIDATAMALCLFKAGFQKILIYSQFIHEWAANPNLPMQKLPRFSKLVPAKWIQLLLSGSLPCFYDNNRYVIVHAHYRNRDAYLSGHIPGAIDMDTLALESPETWNRRSPDELKRALEQHGITADTTVILYGKYMDPDNDDLFPGSAAGDIGAIRCALIMMYAGVKDVRVLNGGFQSWKDAGFEISFTDEPKRPVPEFGAIIPLHPEYIIDMDKAKEYLASTSAELVCVRSWPEYIGEVSGYNYIDKRGHIPGCIFANNGSDAYHMENYRNLDHTTREYHEIAERWTNIGIIPEKELAFYCGTGWRGSEAWFNAWLMGWPHVSVYDGGWYEWSSDPGNPIEVEVPKLNKYIKNEPVGSYT